MEHIVTYFINPKDETDVIKMIDPSFMEKFFTAHPAGSFIRFAGETVNFVQAIADPMDVKNTLRTTSGKVPVNVLGFASSEFTEELIETDRYLSSEVKETNEKGMELEKAFDLKWGWKPEEEQFNTIIQEFIQVDIFEYLKNLLTKGITEKDIKYNQFVILDDDVLRISEDELFGLLSGDPNVTFPTLANGRYILAGVGFYCIQDKKHLARGIIAPYVDLDDAGMLTPESINVHRSFGGVFQAVENPEDAEKTKQEYMKEHMGVVGFEAGKKMLEIVLEREVNDEVVNLAIGAVKP